VPVDAVVYMTTVTTVETIISFTDMWEGFDVKDNFFIDLLRSRGIVGVRGIEGIIKDSALHICGPFGNKWQMVPREIPIVFFSGERWVQEAVYEKSAISLFLTHSPEEDKRHMRLPLWILFLELWGGEPKLRRNPNGLPLSYAIGEDAGNDWKSRKRFCGFVVSNPMNLERNTAFELLNAYEEVDSGGAYKNNIGGPIAHIYGGGGGGDIAKHAFLRERKFCLCYENSSAPGYVTEKLLHAKMAGCVPIYCGCPEAGLIDFDKRGFIDMTGVPVNQIISRIKDVYSDNEAGLYMASIPALGDAELARMWSCVERVGDALLGLIMKHKEIKETNTIKMPSEIIIENSVIEDNKAPVPMFVSFITKRFIPSIEYALESVKKMDDPRIEYLLYIGGDVCEEDISGIRSKYDSFVTIRKIPCDVSPVEGDAFPDFWNPRHFGWKLWIYHQIVHEFSDRLLVFSDAGAQWLKMYPEMFEKAWKTGICFVLDRPENKNRFWCSEEMIAEMKVTEEELEIQQILGGIMAIRGGHKGAAEFFDRCLKYAYNPRNLQGRKLIRILPGGQPVGHRHDQSIMSVERFRSGMGFGYVTEDKATCMDSLRKTLQNGIPIYLHRGNYMANSKALNNVDDLWIINLERRLDRLVTFNNEYPALGETVRRFAAIDGKVLQLTPSIAHMFYHNDFKWKKSVLGCAISHILLWAQLACEGPGVNSYLVMEDDVRFIDHELIDSVLEEVPNDVDVAYLGGVLPRNRTVYKTAIESVNTTWAEIKPNTLFSKVPLPLFHHCNYAYYITKQGARKLINSLIDSGIGCFTSIDHYMGHPVVGIKKYVLIEPIAVCFQDADPAYANAEFDNFNRIDKYDSDIWNNIDTYKVSIPKGFQHMVTQLDIQSIYPLICDVLRQIPSNRETCTLLSPGSFIHMLNQEKRVGEMEFVKQFLTQLQVEMKMPALIPFERRIDSIVCKGGEMLPIDCTAISVVESSGENYNKSCLMSKMFFVGESDIDSIVKHIASVGSVPIYLRCDGDEKRWEELRSRLGLVELRNWTVANKFISILLEQEEKGEKYRWGITEKCLQALSLTQAES
jgi:GR25 family glycosyltransferase involved in LPS biosynthesis